MPTKRSVKNRLKAAKLPERSLQVCLRGDLQAEFDDLERQLKEAREVGGSKRLSAKADAATIARRLETLRGEMAAEMLDLRVRALPRSEWVALVHANPPRAGNDGDEALGVNLEGLMPEALPRCVVDPELDAEDWQNLNDHLSSGDYDRLMMTVWDVNRSGVDVPKSLLASLVMAENGDGSK